MSLAGELLSHFEAEIESLTLLPGDGGRFEIQVNDRLLFSKLNTGQYPAPGEMRRLIEETLKDQ